MALLPFQVSSPSCSPILAGLLMNDHLTLIFRSFPFRIRQLTAYLQLPHKNRIDTVVEAGSLGTLLTAVGMKKAKKTEFRRTACSTIQNQR